MDRSGLNAMIEVCIARFNIMSPADQRDLREAQRKSWAIGELMLQYPEITREYAESIYEKVR